MSLKHYGESIVLASSNPGKLREFSQLLAKQKIHIIAQSELGIPEAEETGLTFVENAILKARNAARHGGLAAIADDSGIEVDALHQAPGIYSARFAGPESSDRENNARLLECLRGVKDAARTARYQCVIAYLRHAEDPTPILCQGTWEGRILHQPRGEGGFGYDPLFLVPGRNCSAAELSPEDKNRLSHRGQALRKLLQALSA